MIDIDLEEVRKRVRGLSPEEVQQVALEMTISAAERSRRRRAEALIARALAGR